MPHAWAWLAAPALLLWMARARRRPIDAAGRRTLSRLQAIEDPATLERVRGALRHVEAAFETYSSEDMAISFNGGKDCLIVLHLVFAYLAMHPEHSLPRVVYFTKHDDFSEMTDFMRVTSAEFRFPLEEIGGGFKAGLQRLCDQGVKAVLMGQRSTDPYAPSSAFEPTTEGWPRVIRVNPILDLDYRGVWIFIKACGLKYCRLYDDGYTSLGSTTSTTPHPELNGLPAHALSENFDERAGRR